MARHGRWIVLHEAKRLRWGGDLRRHHIFLPLARRVRGTLVDGWGARQVGDALPPPRPLLARRPSLASPEMLASETLDLVSARGRFGVLDVHDDVVLQHDAFGIELSPERRSSLTEVQRANLDAFPLHIAQSETFLRLAGLDASRTIIAPNGTDPRAVAPALWPQAPAIAMASGAAPGRGIERLVDAARALRARHPGLRLDLWLVATGAAGDAYLEELRGASTEPWIRIGTAPYDALGEMLGRATVVCVPHPPNAYMDAVIPIKLVDAMAAGRPVVVTPRVEGARVVERAGAGLVASDDSVDGLAAALDRVLSDSSLARRLGAAGRAAAETEFDWRIIGERLADAVLRRLP